MYITKEQSIIAFKSLEILFKQTLDIKFRRSIKNSLLFSIINY